MKGHVNPSFYTFSKINGHSTEKQGLKLPTPEPESMSPDEEYQDHQSSPTKDTVKFQSLFSPLEAREEETQDQDKQVFIFNRGVLGDSTNMGTLEQNTDSAKTLINNIFDLELKRETLIKMKQIYQTRVQERVFYEIDSCTHKCVLSFMELYYKNMG